MWVMCPFTSQEIAFTVQCRLCDVILFVRSPGIPFWMFYTGTLVSTGRLERYKLSHTHIQ